MNLKQMKRTVAKLAVLTTVALIAAVAISVIPTSGAVSAREDEQQGVDPRVAVGLAISPVPITLGNRDRALVGLGSYLVNTFGCNSCHTNPSYVTGHSPYNGEVPEINTAAFLAGGNKFGPYTSRNLTPEKDTGKLDMTFDEFSNAMQRGTDHDQLHPTTPLLQVMPWPYFAKLSQVELLAMYEYLSSIPHADTPK